MSRTLREAAALFVEAGRAMGTAEHARAVSTSLRHIQQLDAADIPGFIDAVLTTRRELEAEAAACERLAAAARGHAEELLAELEQPGARLAKRVLKAAEAARQAWRGHRTS